MQCRLQTSVVSIWTRTGAGGVRSPCSMAPATRRNRTNRATRVDIRPPDKATSHAPNNGLMRRTSAVRTFIIITTFLLVPTPKLAERSLHLPVLECVGMHQERV